MLELTERELATVLAALRHFQMLKPDEAECFPHFDEVEPLNCAEINILCERLNQ